MRPRTSLYLLAAAVTALSATHARAAETGCRLGVMADMAVTMQNMRASVPAKIDGKDTRLWLDSGAFFSIMPRAKAIEFGLKITAAPFGLRLLGVGGESSPSVVTVKKFGIADKALDNIQFLVGGSDSGNGMIGRNLLALSDTEFDLSGGSVKLIRPHDCNDMAIVYWAPGKPFFTADLTRGEGLPDHDFGTKVRINGAEIDAEYDSGAPTTLISRHAAEKAGIVLTGPAVVPINGIGGLGRRSYAGWSVPVESVAIGNETVLKTRLDVIDGPIVAGADGPDMLIGADYMLAHHIYVARSQHRIYFTYSGGKPFHSSAQAPASAGHTGAPLPTNVRRVEAISNAADAPKTADAFARRGNARLAQRAFADAIADLTQAVTLAPNSAEYYRDRASAYQAMGDKDRARADIDKALTLSPHDAGLLRIRAFIRMGEKDRAGALADAEAAARATPPASLDMLPIANVLTELGLPDRGSVLLDPIIAAHREDRALPDLLNARCWMRALANVALDGALDDCNRALKRGTRADILDSRGLVQLRRGNPSAAIADYDAALAIEPKLAWSLYGRGLAKIALGQKDAGAADKASAIAIEPEIVEIVKRYHVIP